MKNKDQKVKFPILHEGLENLCVILFRKDGKLVSTEKSTKIGAEQLQVYE
jgi:hypothetical protein